MKLWLDDIRPAPKGYVWAKSVNEAIEVIKNRTEDINDIDLDHDLGNYAADGGDGICLLDWCVEHQFFPHVSLHTANPVGRANMQRLIDRHWGS